MTCQNNVELHFFISPSHAWHWEGLTNVGLWKNGENRKSELFKINEEEAIKAGKPTCPLWDFSSYNSITTETVPTSNTTMKWYSDLSHYSMACGDLILNRILGDTSLSKPISEDFGIRIDKRNINADLTEISASRIGYALRHSADVQIMANLTKQFWNH